MAAPNAAAAAEREWGLVKCGLLSRRAIRAGWRHGDERGYERLDMVRLAALA